MIVISSTKNETGEKKNICDVMFLPKKLHDSLDGPTIQPIWKDFLKFDCKPSPTQLNSFFRVPLSDILIAGESVVGHCPSPKPTLSPNLSPLLDK